MEKVVSPLTPKNFTRIKTIITIGKKIYHFINYMMQLHANIFVLLTRSEEQSCYALSADYASRPLDIIQFSRQPGN